MAFWYCYKIETYKIETYYENHRLAFKMRKEIFNEIVKSVSALGQESEIRDPFIFFELIFKFFKTTLDSKSNFNFILYNYKQIKYKASWNKNEKFFTIKLLQKFQDNVKFDNYLGE